MSIFKIPSDEPGMTPEELARALKDRVFVDFFNVYLSLPIFSQRLVYKYHDKDFEFDPPLKRRGQVWSRPKLIDWLLRERVCHFMTSELYLDYILCKDLLDTDLLLSQESRRLDYGHIDLMGDRDLLHEHIGHVVGMCKLRKFLTGTMGGALLQFCKDAEHFRRLPKSEEQRRKQMFRVMQIKYFRPGGFCFVDDPQVWKVLEDSSRAVREELSSIIDFRSNQPPPHSFAQLTMVMRCLLKGYWLRRYMLHCSRQDTAKDLEEDTMKVKSLSDLGVIQQLRNIDRAMALVQGNLKPHKRTMKHKSEVTWNALFPCCKIDDTFLTDSDDVLTYQPDGSVVLESMKPEAKSAEDLEGHSLASASFEDAMLFLSSDSEADSELSANITGDESDRGSSEVSPTRLPPLVKNTALLGEDDLPRRNAKLPPLVTDQPLSTIYSRQCLDLRRPRSSPSRDLDVTLPPLKDTKHPNPLRPHTQGRRGALPPIPESRCEPPGTTTEGHHYRRTLRIKPATPYTEGNTSQTFLREHLALSRALAADALAGGPMLSYVRLKRDGKFGEMTLWQQCQTYLTLEPLMCENGDVSHHLRYRLARHMILQYLLPFSEDPVALPDTMANDLVRLLPNNEGKSLLQEAQDHLTTVLSPIWQDYCLWDRDTFLNAVVTRRPTRPHSLLTGVGEDHMSEESYTAPLEKQDLVQGVARYGAADALAPPLDDSWPPVDAEQDYMSLSEQRTCRALRLSLEVAQIDPYQVALDDGPLEELEYETETQLGSLAVKKLVVVRRADLIEELERRRRLAMAIHAAKLARQRAAAIMLSVQQTEEEEDLPPFARPFRRHGAWVHRPSKPRTFSEMMRNHTHVDFFKRFLAYHLADTPINFWIAVEELKSCKDPRIRQQSVNQILRRYFMSAKRYAALDSTAEVIREIPKMDKVTPAMLVSAQSCIATSLDAKWFNIYMATFAGHLEEAFSRAKIVKEPGARKWGKEKTRALWKQFVRGVMRFREGILNEKHHRQFANHIRQEVAKEISRQRHMGNMSIGFGVPIRKVIINKLVDMGKLVADLNFLAEGERFRTLCDNATEAANMGIYRTGDQQLLELKAKTIIDCFLCSDMQPKIQVNASQEICENVIDNFHSGLVDRSLFHDAWISVFPIIAHLWKKFMRIRVMSVFMKADAADTLLTRKVNTPRTSTPNYMNLRIENARMIVAHAYADDDHTRLIFSMSHGLRIVQPVLHERTTSEESQLDETRRPTNLWNDPGVEPDLVRSPALGEGDEGQVDSGSYHDSRRRSSIVGVPRFTGGGMGSHQSTAGSRRSILAGRLEESSHSVADGVRSRIAGSQHGKLGGSQHGKLVDSQHSTLNGSQDGKLSGSQHSRSSGSHNKIQFSTPDNDSRHQIHSNKKSNVVAGRVAKQKDVLPPLPTDARPHAGRRVSIM